VLLEDDVVGGGGRGCWWRVLLLLLGGLLCLLVDVMFIGRYMCQPIMEPAALRGRVLLDLTAPEVH
jgi:hypothetical protein